MKYFLIFWMLLTTTVFAQQTKDEPEPMIENSLIFRKFDSALFEKAQSSGKSILLIFSKSDCPGCRTQAPTLAKILKEPEYKDLEIFQIDFMKQQDLNTRFDAKGWTLLVGFKGTKEVRREFALKRPSELKQFLNSLL